MNGRVVKTRTRRPYLSVWLIALGAAMWGLDAVFIVALQRHMSSTQIVFLEHLLLALFSVPVLIWKRHELKRLNIGDWIAVLFIAWGGSALASILFAVGLQHGNANVVLVLQKLQPVFAVLLAASVLKERVSRGYWLLLLAALIGAYLLTFGFGPVTGIGAAGRLVGALCALGAAMLWGGSTAMGKRLVGKVSFSTVTALRFAAALPFLFVIVECERPDWASLGVALTMWPVIANLLFQTIVPSLLSLLIYYKGLNGVKASHATIAELAFPATGLLLNWLILHETITAGQWVGFAVIWLAVFQMSRLPKDKVRRSMGGSIQASL
ncbi:EamA family transporter [Alicyclobacillus acidoterrestris]|uniref:DMT family transporter n=1 Tax=Alicyclobacillus suci TaxID=2816080 RepID=UPI001195141D|nr:EamA family transporter [Alicyclobacillus suci]GEO24269.1 EamA family transporter [Alicyclobacillus acidoterrestris]